MKFWGKWMGNVGYYEVSLQGRKLTDPWALDGSRKFCQLRCDDSFWIDWKYWKPLEWITDGELIELDEDARDHLVEFPESNPWVQDYTTAESNVKDYIFKVIINHKGKEFRFIEQDAVMASTFSDTNLLIFTRAGVGASHSQSSKNNRPWTKGTWTVELGTKALLYNTSKKLCPEKESTDADCGATEIITRMISTKELIGVGKILGSGNSITDTPLDILHLTETILKDTNVNISKQGRMIIGWIPTNTPGNDPLRDDTMYVFAGKYSRDNTKITGIFVSRQSQDYGVFIIKAYPSDQSNSGFGSGGSATNLAPYRTAKLIMRLRFTAKTTNQTYILYEDQISLGLRLDALNQRCTSSNCKTWGDGNIFGFKNCQSCFKAGDLDLAGEFHTNWPGKLAYTVGGVEGIDRENPFTLSGNPTVNYSYCKSYDSEGICQCFPEWHNGTSEMNACWLPNLAKKNCISANNSGFCNLCKPGFTLDTVTNKCICNDWTNTAHGECNDSKCFEDYKSCRHCDVDTC
jgi:hypothetical protein